MSTPMRILCIDGGGMKGVYACAYLKVMEEHFQKPLHEHFDLIAGTSTGGIIALGLAAGKSAEELLGFYTNHGPAIFPEGKANSRWKVVKLVQNALHLKKRLNQGYWYDSEPLRSALNTVLSNSDGKPLLMREARTRLLIPAVNAHTAFPRVFKAHTGEQQVAHLQRDLNIAMSEVALATAAAPWYLPIAKVMESGTPYTYIDGGLWANNPSILAVTEALQHYVGEERNYDRIHLISIALPSTTGFSNDAQYHRGQKFIDQLLSYSMESSKHGADQTTKFLLSDPRHTYFRVSPTNLTEDQAKRLRLDSSDERAIGELKMLGDDRANNDKTDPILRTIFT